MKVLETLAIPMTEAKKMLEKREKERELGYEQKIAVEHLKKFTKINDKDAEKMINELSEVLKMSHETLSQIVNLLPKNPDELRLIFAKEKFSLREEEVSKILEIVKKYA